MMVARMSKNKRLIEELAIHVLAMKYPGHDWNNKQEYIKANCRDSAVGILKKIQPRFDEIREHAEFGRVEIISSSRTFCFTEIKKLCNLELEHTPAKPKLSTMMQKSIDILQDAIDKLEAIKERGNDE